jgi:hypothetical protein
MGVWLRFWFGYWDVCSLRNPPIDPSIPVLKDQSNLFVNKPIEPQYWVWGM